MRLKTAIRAEALFQIFLVVVATFAFSYMIGSLSEELSVVEAAASDPGCCAVTKDGDYCRGDVSQVECAAGNWSSGVTCDNSISCGAGCCIDAERGTCTQNTLIAKCNAEDGLSNGDIGCNVPQCTQGCCVLGGETKFVNSEECSYLSAEAGLEIDYRPEVGTEIGCIALEGAQQRGACVFGNESSVGCEILTKQECLGLTGSVDSFHSDTLCSAPDLNTTCERQVTTGCVDGRDEVYWFDSCGNAENIFSSDEDFSWNNGVIMDKGESCNPDGSNANSAECGNCNYLAGSRCSTDNGEAVCKDMNCAQAVTNGGVKKNQKNGESWCVYDGMIGTSRDIVGSRHWKRMCIDGEVKVEPCEDYRNGLCAMTTKNGFSNAVCRPNRAEECMAGGSSTDCFSMAFDFDEDYEFDMTLAAYPTGFDMQNLDQYEEKCAGAYFECTMIEVKTLFSGWECEVGCECAESEFANQMNYWCRSLGDCGISVNIAGKGTNAGISVEDGDSISWQSKGILAKPVAHQKVPVGDSMKYAEQALTGRVQSNYSSRGESVVGSEEEAEEVPHDNDAEGWEPDDIEGKEILKGAVLSVIGVGAFSLLLGGFSNSGGGKAVAAAEGGLAGSGAISGLGNLGMGAAVGALVGFGISKLAGVKGDAAIATTYGAGIAGAVGGFTATGASFAGGASVAGGTSLIGGSSIAAGSFSSGSVIVAGNTFVATAAGPITVATNAVAGTVTVTTSAISATGATVTTATTLTATGATIGTGGATVAAGTTATAGAGTATASAGLMGTVAAAFIWALVAAIVIVIIMKLLGIGDTRETTTKFSCHTWQPPSGGSDCKKCNGNPLKPCSRYRCETLGSACVFINEGTGFEMCIHENPGDSRPPQISPNEDIISESFRYENIGGDGFSIAANNGECITENTPVVFGIETNEVSRCKLDTNHTTSLEEMALYFGNSPVMRKEHASVLNSPSQEATLYSLGVNASDIPDEVMAEINSVFDDQLGNRTMFVRCEDRNGNYNQNEFKINYCIKEGPDRTPPKFLASTQPELFLAYGESSQNITVIADEIVECRWAYNDTDYDSMTNNMYCDSQLTGSVCASTVTGLDGTDNKIYVRCEDQPWFEGEVNETDRNVNTESFVFTFKKSSTPLTIQSIEPNADFEVATNPTTVTLAAATRGGAESGKATCSYDLDGAGSGMKSTGGSSHSQVITWMNSGTKNLKVSCVDIAGNTAENSTRFKITYDSSTPQIARIWQSGGQMYFITNEDADCRYGTSSNGFKWAEASDAGSGRNHDFSVVRGNTYYIKCEDEFGRAPSGFSITARAV